MAIPLQTAVPLTWKADKLPAAQDTHVFRCTLVPPDSAVCLLYGEGAGGALCVNCNGFPVYTVPDPFTSFWADLTGFLHIGKENTLEIVVKNSSLLLPVTLCPKCETHLLPGTFRIRTRKRNETIWEIEASCRIRHMGLNARRCQLRLTCGDTVADGAAVCCPPDSTVTAQVTMQIAAPRVWEPDDPYLHSVTLSLFADEKETDAATQTTGFREIRIDPDTGCILNGKVLKLRGMSVKNTVTAEEISAYRQAGYRLLCPTDGPLTASFTRACDRAGMLFLGVIPDLPFSRGAQISALSAGVGHPSLLGWRIGHTDCANASYRFRRMRNLIWQNDPQTPCVTDRPDYAQECDILICNAAQAYDIRRHIPALPLLYAGTDIPPDFCMGSMEGL